MYLWAASIDGDMTVKGIKVDVEDPDFRYVNTRIAVNPRRTSVYATE
jgi:hypothetical protein